ncbi:MAG: alpha-amylase family glycosyl hydrolase [Simkaniaceae bacterium]
MQFKLYSESAKKVDLLLFSDDKLIHRVPLEKKGASFFLELDADKYSAYAFSVDDSKPLIDPYAKEISLSPFPHALIPKERPFDFENIVFPKIPFDQLIIYEAHVKGFTASPTSKVASPGTFLGMIEKIPYLVDLGVNAIELMPINAFDPKEHLEETPLSNFWGYSPINFFSIHSPFGSIHDLKRLVKELHRNGIEILLDVVFNHTGRGDLCFEAIDKKTFYILSKDNKHTNYTGCGNTFSANHPASIEMICEALCYFVETFHIDGFRFDLASTLTRDHKGKPLSSPPLLKRLAEEVRLKNTKFIVEPWDPGGLYQVGSFPHFNRFVEWNGKYRDSIRRFLKGGKKAQNEFKHALLSSKCIQFITSHDGFTLNDLVTYQKKRNKANLENNLDGMNENENWNMGVEGPSSDLRISKLRRRQIKNFLTALFTSMGTPMLLMGDEVRRTREGNNNGWCQDNALNYLYWYRDLDLLNFTQKLIRLRKRWNIPSCKVVEFHNLPETNRLVGCTFTFEKKALYVAFNADDKDHTILFPKVQKNWSLFLSSQDELSEIDFNKSCIMPSYSSLILLSE